MLDGFIRRWALFDTFLLDRCFQPLSDWVMDQTGNSCFWLGKWTIRLLFAASVGSVMWIARDAYFDPKQLPLVVSICAIAFMIQPYTLFKLSTFLDEKERDLIAEIEIARAVNPYRLKLADRRFSGVMYSILTWPLVGMALAIVREGLPLSLALQTLLSLFTIAVYFLSCTPKPRSPQKQPKLALSPT